MSELSVVVDGTASVLTVESQVVRSHQELEAEFYGDFHIRNVFSLSVLVPVVEVLDNLLEHHSAMRPSQSRGLKMAADR